MLHLLLTVLAPGAELHLSADADQLTEFFDDRVKAAAKTPFTSVHDATSAATAPTVVTSSHTGLQELLGHSSEYRLIYMTLRGLGDLPHLVADFFDLKYTMLHVGPDDMKAIKPLLPFGRLPLLLECPSAPACKGATTELAQSGAIVRHLYRKAAAAHHRSPLLPAATEEHFAKADMWYEQVKESFVSHQAWGKAFNSSALKAATPAELAAAPSHYRDTRNRGTYTDLDKSLVALRTFEEQLGASGGGTLTGGPISYAELALFLQLWELLEADQFPLALTALKLPHLDKFVRDLAARPKVAKYLAGKRMPRSGPFDGTSYPFKPGRTVLPDLKEEL